METPDRSLYDTFQADQRTQSLRALRSTLETKIDEHFSVVRLLASADEQLSFESLHAAKNALLRALQIQYAINVACDKVSGHDEVIAKIKSNIDEKIQKSVAYVNHANRWVAMIEGTGPSKSQEKLND